MSCIFSIFAIVMNDSTYTIYFGEHRVAFLAEPPADADSVIYAESLDAVSRAKVIKKVETDKFVAIVAKNPCEALCSRKDFLHIC